MDKRYYITTPIYYVNAVPHIGTALTTLVSDVTARYQKMQGRDVTFLTGSDENGLKVKEAAEAQGKTPEAYVYEISEEFKKVWGGMHIEYDDFIRTTEPRHVACVQEFFRQLLAKGHVYKDKYVGWYDVSSETFYKEADLVDGKSPDGNEVRWVEEENYFFRLSAFEQRLLDHIEQNPHFIRPEGRKNEVLSFIKQGLRDTCISRTNQGWGIPVPDDDSKVVYVWFDALINYVSASGWPNPGYDRLWPAEVQWMGKDILTRFHATLWPAMLMAVDLPLPEALVGHAWLMMGGEKISKSKGNVVRPLELAEALSSEVGCERDIAIDAVRYFMAANLPMESDSTYTRALFDGTYNADLANDLGNALNRSLSMTAKFCDGVIPGGEPEREAAKAIFEAKGAVEVAMADFRIDAATRAAWDVVRFLNKYIDTRAPWALAKAQDPALNAVLRSMLLCLRASEGLVRFILPSTADAIARQLNLPPTRTWDEIGEAASLPAGTKLGEPVPIFPRIDTKAKKTMETATPAPTPAPAKAPEPKTPPAEITIDDFMKVQLRVGRIVEAEPLEGSDKLLKLQVMIGDEKRQVVAGIRKSYQPIDLIGRQVVVVANLKAAKLRGADSQGMLLAASDSDGSAILLQPDRETPEGADVH
jgi:methionyl-tRNA synthetase